MPLPLPLPLPLPTPSSRAVTLRFCTPAAVKRCLKGEPQAATVADYDSDGSCVKPGTEVSAKQNASAGRRHEPQKTPSRTPKQAQATTRREPSDSGYSSQNSTAQAQAQAKAKAMPAPLSIPTQNAARQPASTPMSPTKSNTKRPIVHRHDSGRSRSQTTVQPASKPHDKCDDRNCRDPDCPTSRNKERRKTMYVSQPLPSPATAHPYAQIPPYQYGRKMPPPPLPLQRTASRPGRPQSFHAGMPLPYSASQPGPPPAQSAYYYTQGYGQPSAYAATPSSQQIYVPASPVTPMVPPSPTSPNAAGYPGYPGGIISARIPNPNVAGMEPPKLAPNPGLPIRTSARRPDNRPPPATYPNDSATTSDSETGSDCESEEEYQRRREAAGRRRRRSSYVDHRSKSRPRNKSRGHDAVIATVTRSTHSRRPSMGKSYYTDSYVPTRRNSLRDPRTERLHRAPYSDNGPGYSSDNFDSDRTSGAVVHTRHSAPTSKQHSRRPSVSTNASSGGTKATTLSSVTDYSRAIIEDSRGRRVVYLSKEQQAELIKQHQRQKLQDSLDEQERLANMRFNAASDYQKEMSGGVDGYQMSAENIKNLNRTSKPPSRSHMSGRSGKSAGSGSKASRSNGVKIHAGGTVLHVDGDMAMQVRTTDDGEVHLVLGNGREIEYNSSSKGSSRSRVSRGRDRNRIPEADEGGYERPL
ncbi:uncharacterized protein MYCFIDRAFT_195204 [Pseudocercospora fijiensis CIRAD86]|uniref:Uncharacterized protein n=1 Tax=Pseudocercospora fijiensis (strain CIRAD86) TaxID=383855 RepID=M2ZYK6_PSEFD|nr:uncharacterized protein MYCFIDRAFT_195204 [Pseudocercospora fijiensis CIRAD86]EME84034.1 hypothetical protein MYCFIDRAFT_195204 [Pseudocercospora fijiensis CIRAD86]